jgi:hypothetical protein
MKKTSFERKKSNISHLGFQMDTKVTSLVEVYIYPGSHFDWLCGNRIHTLMVTYTKLVWFKLAN